METSEPTWEKAFAVVEPQINADGIHVWPFDLSFPIDVRFFDLNGCQDIRLNRHNYYELLYVYSGRAKCQIQDRRFWVKEGDLVVIGSNLYHRLTGVASPQTKVIVLFFQRELVGATEASEDHIEYMMPFFMQGRDFPHVIPVNTGIPDQAVELIKQIQAELPANSNRARLAVRTYLKMILMLMVNHYAAFLAGPENSHLIRASVQRLRPLFEYLEGHYNERIRVEDVARICGTSNSHFMYFFKQATGQSFLAYLNRFRIAKARSLLISTESPISEISQEVGFCDQSHFGVVFRKLVGMTPLGYRHHFHKASEITPPESAGPMIQKQTPPLQRFKGPLFRNERENLFPPDLLSFGSDQV